MTGVSVLLLQAYQSDPTRYDYDNINLPLFQKHVTSILETNPDTTILVCEIIERIVFTKKDQQAINSVLEILDKLTRNYFIVVDGMMNHQIYFSDRVVCLSGGMLLAYYHIWMNNNPHVSEWNPTSNKGLLLLGKCEKVHRIGLLKKFYERDLLEKIEWSAFFPSQRKLIQQKFFGEYTDDQFDAFVSKCSRTLDIPSEHPCYPKTPFQSFQHYGFPFDHALYQQTAFSIVTESEYCTTAVDVAWLSEKTWRAIANKHPFIMVGNEVNLLELKKLGFRTFEEYLDIPQYYTALSDTRDPIISMDSIVTNTNGFVSFLESADENTKAAIRADVNHNYDLFYSIITNQIEVFLDKTNLPLSAIKDIIEYQMSN